MRCSKRILVMTLEDTMSVYPVAFKGERFFEKLGEGVYVEKVLGRLF